jgi:hypothetical protein
MNGKRGTRMEDETGEEEKSKNPNARKDEN